MLNSNGYAFEVKNTALKFVKRSKHDITLLYAYFKNKHCSPYPCLLETRRCKTFLIKFQFRKWTLFSRCIELMEYLFLRNLNSFPKNEFY